MNKEKIKKLRALSLPNIARESRGIGSGGYVRRNSSAKFSLTVWPKIKKYFNRNSIVLDVGCGNGRFSNFMSRHVKEVRAIDGYTEMEKCNQAPNINFSMEKVENFFSGRKYDVVFLYGVFYLFPFPENIGVFGKLLDFLSPAGVLIIIEDTGCNKEFYDLERYSDAFGASIEEMFDTHIEESWQHKTTVIKKTK